MNKLIQKLAYESALAVEVNLMTQDPAFVEKFAELLIQKCALALDETIAPTSCPLNSIGYKLKNHFGIE